MLDSNSCYLYLRLCRDFAETCIVAEHADSVVGFVTGYRPPEREGVIFLWQIGITRAMRRRGLGKKLVSAFLGCKGAQGASLLETTVSPSNTASRALFRAVARDLDTECRVSQGFTTDQFPDDEHEAEDLFRIGPLDLPDSSFMYRSAMQ